MIHAVFFDYDGVLTRDKTGSLTTDNKRDRIEHLRIFQGLDAVFDPIVVSSVVDASKEGPAIFRHALQRVGLAPGQALFIDNCPDNLAAPAALGMQTVHFDDERRDVPALTAELQQLGLSI